MNYSHWLDQEAFGCKSKAAHHNKSSTGACVASGKEKVFPFILSISKLKHRIKMSLRKLSNWWAKYQLLGQTCLHLIPLPCWFVLRLFVLVLFLISYSPRVTNVSYTSLTRHMQPKDLHLQTTPLHWPRSPQPLVKWGGHRGKHQQPAQSLPFQETLLPQGLHQLLHKSSESMDIMASIFFFCCIVLLCNFFCCIFVYVYNLSLCHLSFDSNHLIHISHRESWVLEIRGYNKQLPYTSLLVLLWGIMSAWNQINC